MENGLAGRRVLVVEDEYFLADDLVNALADAGAEVVGPASEESDALRLIGDQAVDLAVVDINLKGKASFLIADVLAARGIPFVFATGYDADILPERHAQVSRWEKPFRLSALMEQLGRFQTQRARFAVG